MLDVLLYFFYPLETDRGWTHYQRGSRLNLPFLYPTMRTEIFTPEKTNYFREGIKKILKNSGIYIVGQKYYCF